MANKRIIVAAILICCLVAIDLHLRFRGMGSRWAPQPQMLEQQQQHFVHSVQTTSLTDVLSRVNGTALANLLDGYEWRLFIAKEEAPKVRSGRHLLRTLEEKIRTAATRIGYDERDLQLGHKRPESRCDVYIDIGDPAVGLKYRGGGGKRGSLLELKLRHRVVSTPKFVSERDLKLENWDKIIKSPIGKDGAGAATVLKILAQALDEFTALKHGSELEQFRYDFEKERLLREALEAAEGPGGLKEVKLCKERRRAEMEISSKLISQLFKFEVTSVETLDGRTWWSLAVEGPTNALSSLFADIVLQYLLEVEKVQEERIIFAGYPGFLMTL